MPKCVTGYAKRSVRWRRRMCCTGPIRCRKPARAKSCAAFCVRLPQATPATSAIPRPSPILRRRGKTARREAGHYHAIVSKDRFLHPLPFRGEDKNKSLPEDFTRRNAVSNTCPGSVAGGVAVASVRRVDDERETSGDAKMNEQLCQRMKIVRISGS